MSLTHLGDSKKIPLSELAYCCYTDSIPLASKLATVLARYFRDKHLNIYMSQKTAPIQTRICTSMCQGLLEMIKALVPEALSPSPEPNFNGKVFGLEDQSLNQTTSKLLRNRVTRPTPPVCVKHTRYALSSPPCESLPLSKQTNSLRANKSVLDVSSFELGVLSTQRFRKKRYMPKPQELMDLVLINLRSLTSSTIL